MPLLNALLAKTPIAVPTDAVAPAETNVKFPTLALTPAELPHQAVAPVARMPSLPAAAPMDVPAAAPEVQPPVATSQPAMPPAMPTLPQIPAQAQAAPPAMNAAPAKPLKITTPVAATPVPTAEPAATESAADEPVVAVATPTDPQQILLGALMAAAGMPSSPPPTSAKPVGGGEPSLPVQASPVAKGRAAIATPRSEEPAKPLVISLRPDFVVNPESSKPFEMPLPVANQEVAAPVTVQVAPQALLHAADPAANNVQFAPRATPTEAPQVQIPVPAHDPGFGAAVGERLAVVINEGHHRAELRLDPPELGTVSVQIDLKGDRASLNFVAPTEAARDALAQALPDLRNALASQGLSLTQTNIGSESRPQAQGNPEPRGNAGNASEPHASQAEAAPMRMLRRGLVDEYA